jgi:DNA mismatch endonuclease (patch repair protein)
MDTLTASQRSERMARIRSKNTGPELAVRRLAHSLGYRYRLHVKGLPGSPDLVFGRRRKVVFIHGCFWHCHEGCSVANRPKTRTAFWDAKFARNKQRDYENLKALSKKNWRALTLWECELNDLKTTTKKLRAFLGPVKKA